MSVGKATPFNIVFFCFRSMSSIEPARTGHQHTTTINVDDVSY